MFKEGEYEKERQLVWPEHGVLGCPGSAGEGVRDEEGAESHWGPLLRVLFGCWEGVGRGGRGSGHGDQEAGSLAGTWLFRQDTIRLEQGAERGQLQTCLA